MATPRLSATYTYGDYLQWTGDERWELYDGVPVLMNSPSNRHQEILGLQIYFINDCIRSNGLSNKQCTSA